MQKKKHGLYMALTYGMYYTVPYFIGQLSFVISHRYSAAREDGRLSVLN